MQRVPVFFQRLWLALMFSALANVTFCAPVPPREGNLRLAHLFHRPYKVQDLRAPPNIAAFAQFSDGAFWTGGFRGLGTFNGVNWAATTPGRQAEDSRDIVRLLVDPEDSLWLGLQDGRVTRIRKIDSMRFDRGNGLPPGRLMSLFQDRIGTIWVANRSGLAAFVSGQWRPSSLPYAAIEIAAAFADREGSLWLVDSRGALFRRREHAASFEKLGQVQPLTAPRAVFAQSRDGSVWVAGGKGGVWQIRDADLGSPHIHRWFPERQVDVLLADRAGHLWLGGRGIQLLSASSIAKLPTEKVELDEFDTRDGLTGDFVREIYEDRDGLIWVSTDAGMDRFFHSEFVGFPLPRSMKGAKSLLATADGLLWVADREAETVIAIRGDRIAHEFRGQFTAAARDFTDGAWFGGPSGLVLARAQRVQRHPLPDGATGKSVLSLAVTPAGVVWASIADAGLFTFERGTWNKADLPGLVSPPMTLLADSDGIWLGYHDDVLARLRGGELTLFTENNGLAVGNITAMDIDGSRLWVGGDNGLAVLEAGRFRNVRMRNCPSFNSMVSVHKTRNGGYWQYFGSALTHVSGPTAIKALAEHEPRFDCDNFGFADTLPGSPQSAPSQPMAETTDQRLWFSAGGRLLYKDLRTRLVDVAPPKAQMLDVAVRHGSIGSLGSKMNLISSMQGMKIAPGPDYVSFRYTAWQLWAAERVRFRYKLSGIDQEWQFQYSPWNNGYNNLDPGDYVFQIAAGNGDNIWSDTTELRFRIEPYFHQTWWFYSLCALAGLAIIAMLFWFQLRRVSNRLRTRLSERMLERERIARELHDTLLQGFQGLILRFQGAIGRLPAAEPVRQTMDKLLDDADAVLIESRDRVSELRQSPYESGELPDAIADAARKLTAEGGMETRLTVLGTPRDIDVAVHAETFLIAREALSNAVRHADARLVEVQLVYERSALRLTIRDNGRGIDDAVLRAGGRPGHWGLKGMRERANRLRASLAVRKRLEGGTEIELRIPASLAFNTRRHSKE